MKIGRGKKSIGILSMVALVLVGCNDGQRSMSAHADTSNTLPTITQQDVVTTDADLSPKKQETEPLANVDVQTHEDKNSPAPSNAHETKNEGPAATAMETHNTGSVTVVEPRHEEKGAPANVVMAAKEDKRTIDGKRSTSHKSTGKSRAVHASTPTIVSNEKSASAKPVAAKINVSPPGTTERKVVNTYAASIDMSYRVSSEGFYIHRANLRILDSSLINNDQSRYLLSVGPVPKTPNGAFPYSVELLPAGQDYKKTDDHMEIYAPALANIQDTALAITLKDNDDAETTLRYATPFVLIYDSEKKLAQNVSMYVAQDGYATIDGGSMVQLHAQSGCTIGYYADRSFVRLGTVLNNRIHFDGNFQQATSMKYKNAQINCESTQSKALVVTEDKQTNVTSNVHFSFYFENLYLHSS